MNILFKPERRNKNERVIVAHTKRILMIQCYSKYGESEKPCSFYSLQSSVCVQLKLFEYFHAIQILCCVSFGIHNEYESYRIGYACNIHSSKCCSMVNVRFLQLKIGKSVTKLNPLFRQFDVFRRFERIRRIKTHRKS